MNLAVKNVFFVRRSCDGENRTADEGIWTIVTKNKRQSILKLFNLSKVTHTELFIFNDQWHSILSATMTKIVTALAKAQLVVNKFYCRVARCNHFRKGFPYPLQRLLYYHHPWTMIEIETTERETEKKMTTTNNLIPSTVLKQEISENRPSKILCELLLITDLWL